MKRIINTYFKIIVAMVMITGLCSKAGAQVNGFTINDPVYPTNHNLNATFPVNVSFNWTPTTTSATVTINYNAALVSYDASCSAVLPSCMSVTTTGSQLTITISSLAACTNTGAISFNVCFKFNCPDSCTGVQKPTTFNGTITDNLLTTQTSNCNANGILNNNVSLTHNFYS
jgi:hypothetical protein